MSKLHEVVPTSGHRDIDWSAIKDAFPEWRALEECEHDKNFHAEGNVWLHTQLVCEALVQNADFQALDERGRRRMFLAALLHDIAKPPTTKVEEDGRVTSKGHSKKGEQDARVRLWLDGYDFEDREAVCRMIACHQQPFFLYKKEGAAFELHKLSQEMSLKELALLADADAHGRLTNPAHMRQDTIDNVELFRLMAQDEGCYEQPRQFADEHTRAMYFRKDGGISPDFPYFPTIGSEVLVMSGLPASGKNTWLARHHPELSVVSFDDARIELGSDGDNDGKVAHYAYDKAKELLRAKEPFAWNATFINPLLRKKALDLLYAYGARVRLVYLESAKDTLLSRNSKRDTTLPNKTLLGMVHKWEVPRPHEAHQVEYIVG